MNTQSGWRPPAKVAREQVLAIVRAITYSEMIAAELNNQRRLMGLSDPPLPPGSR